MAWTGKDIKHFRILEKRGEGSLGAVYRARDTKQDAVRAIKLIRPALAADAAFLARLTHAAHALARFDHPHLVPTYWFFEKPPQPFLVMEYVEGPSLAELIARRAPLPPRQVVPLFEQVLDGLAYAHEKGAVHRNLHPGEVLLTHDGHVRLADFGLVRGPEGTAPAAAGPPRAALHYLSPEHIRSRAPVDARSDLYAVGAMLYHALTGHTPFAPQDEPFRVLRAIVEDDIPAPTCHVPSLPPPLAALVMKALAREPSRRFETAEAMRAALATLDPVADPVAPPEAAAEARRGRGVFAGGIVATVAVAALLAWWALRGITPVATPAVAEAPPDTLVLTPGLFEQALPANGAPADQAELAFVARPYGTLYLDGEAVGTDSLTQTLGPGTYRAGCEHPRYGRQEAPVVLGPGQRKSVTCFFEAAVAVAARDVAGAPLRAALYVDEQATARQTPRTYHLPPGLYTVEVFLEDYLAEPRLVAVRPTVETPLATPPAAPLTFILRKAE